MCKSNTVKSGEPAIFKRYQALSAFTIAMFCVPEWGRMGMRSGVPAEYNLQNVDIPQSETSSQVGGLLQTEHRLLFMVSQLPT